MGTPHKHFTRHDRDLIEKLLDQDTTARNIAAHLDKSERAVSYEVRRHRQEYKGGSLRNSPLASHNNESAQRSTIRATVVSQQMMYISIVL